MKVEIRSGEDVLLYDALDVEQEVREGKLSLDTPVRGGVWTGGEWKPLRSVAALAEAADSPFARFGDHMRRRSFPWVAAGTGLVLLVAGVVQSVGTLAGMLSGGAWSDVEGVVLRLALGWVPSVLNFGFWTPWTSLLTHAGLGHVLSNLPVWLYSGWRVERALGRSGFLAVVATAVCVATPTIVYLSDLPVIGSSIGAFALLGAQVGVGLRMGERIPEGQRRYYGFANLVVSLPMFALTWDNPMISHLGHFSGLVGGLAAAMVVPMPTAAKKARATMVGLANVGLAAGLGLLPVALVVALGFLPRLAGLPWEEELFEEGGMTLEMPRRMHEIEARFAGMTCWLPDANATDGVFAGAWLLRVGEAADDALLRSLWERRLGAVELVGTRDLDLPEGWTARTWRTGGDEGTHRIVEATTTRGRYLYRVGWVVDGHTWEGGPKERMFAEIVHSAALREPKDLVTARERWTKWPDDGKFTYAYAQELIAWGEAAKADELLAGLLPRTDGWEWESVRSMLALWEATPAAETRLTPEVVGRFVAEAPVQDHYVVGPGSAWLVERGGCGVVQAALPRWRQEAVDARQSAMDGLVQAEEAAATTCAAAAP